jgi:UDP-N-acetylmuramyl pentapeptide phosphotransferase/UDP-N-acetylglucosamine-1-phosphate transferase
MGKTILVLVLLYASVVMLFLSILRKQGYRFGLVDIFNSRSSHTGAIPRVGGLALFLPFVSLGFVLNIFDSTFIRANMPFWFGLLSMVILGSIDDRLDLSGKLKFLIQLVVGFSYIFVSGDYINTLYGLFGVNELSFWFGALISGFTIVFVINAVNLSDGIDGLSAGTSLLSILAFALITGHSEHLFILSFLGIGLVLFLRFNLSENKKVFLGDAGSLGLGFVLATMALEFLHSGNNHVQYLNINPHFAAMLVLGYPIADTSRVFVLRVISGHSPFKADRRHLHHILLDKGYTHIGATTFIILCVSVVLIVNKILAPMVNEYITIFINCVLVLLIHLYVKFRSKQLCKFWRSFSRMVFKPVKKVLTRFAID